MYIIYGSYVFTMFSNYNPGEESKYLKDDKSEAKIKLVVVVRDLVNV